MFPAEEAHTLHVNATPKVSYPEKCPLDIQKPCRCCRHYAIPVRKQHDMKAAEEPVYHVTVSPYSLCRARTVLLSKWS